MKRKTEQGVPMVTIPNTEAHTLHSETTNTQYDIYVFVPNGYYQQKNAEQEYPVLYHLDGYFTFGIVSDIVRNLQGGLTKPFLVVSTSYGAGCGQPGNMRMRDYTPGPHRLAEDGGGAEAFSQFLKNELMPFIMKTYRVKDQPRTFHGSSLGGIMGAYLLFKETDLFANYILSSPAIWVNQQDIHRLEEEYHDNNSDLPKKIYLSAGTEEMIIVQSAIDFYTTLRERDYPGLKMKFFWGDGETHQTSTMALLPHILQEVYPPETENSSE